MVSTYTCILTFPKIKNYRLVPLPDEEHPVKLYVEGSEPIMLKYIYREKSSALDAIINSNIVSINLGNRGIVGVEKLKALKQAYEETEDYYGKLHDKIQHAE